MNPSSSYCSLQFIDLKDRGPEFGYNIKWQAAKYLIGRCFKAKVHYWLRTTKLELLDPFIDGFEQQKREILTTIMDHGNATGTTTMPDLTWTIAQQTIKCGGLGLENLHSVKFAAVIAAAFQATEVVFEESQLALPVQPGKKKSIIRDFHTAHAVLLRVDETLNRHEGVRQATHDSITMSLLNILRVYGIHARREVCVYKKVDGYCD